MTSEIHQDSHAGDDAATAPPKSRMPLVIAVVVIAGAFAYLVYGGIAKNITWDMTPNQLMAQGTKAYDHPVRLGGQVVPGSVVWDADRLGVQFAMRDTTGPAIAVQSRAIPSAMFREGIGVVVEGKYTRDDAGQSVFRATTLMVKHSNEYQPPAGAHKSSDAYKTLLKDGK